MARPLRYVPRDSLVDLPETFRRQHTSHAVSDGIDFLGYIVRPNYLLVRRRVVENLRERLERAEASLLRAGMTVARDGRSVFPWPWPVLFEVRQWLNSYLGYLRRASTHRLVARLRERNAWLAEYFEWREWKVELRCPVPRFALRFKDQVACFREQLPGHVLMIQKGGFWQAVVPGSVASQAPAAGLPVVDGQRVRRSSPGSAVEGRLWQSGVPVAWVGETGRRLTDIAERALVCRWAGARSVERPAAESAGTRWSRSPPGVRGSALPGGVLC